MTIRIVAFLLTSACGVFVASCGPVPDVGKMRHPSLAPAEQLAVRDTCTRAAQAHLGTAPPAAPPAACREDGDASARDRCRAQADLALIAQTRYIQQLDAEIAACLRARGFRD